MVGRVSEYKAGVLRLQGTGQGVDQGPARYTAAQMFVCDVRRCLLPRIWHVAGVNHASTLLDGPKPQPNTHAFACLDFPKINLDPMSR